MSTATPSFNCKPPRRAGAPFAWPEGPRRGSGYRRSPAGPRRFEQPELGGAAQVGQRDSGGPSSQVAERAAGILPRGNGAAQPCDRRSPPTPGRFQRNLRQRLLHPAQRCRAPSTTDCAPAVGWTWQGEQRLPTTGSIPAAAAVSPLLRWSATWVGGDEIRDVPAAVEIRLGRCSPSSCSRWRSSRKRSHRRFRSSNSDLGRVDAECRQLSPPVRRQAAYPIGDLGRGGITRWSKRSRQAESFVAGALSNSSSRPPTAVACRLSMAAAPSRRPCPRQRPQPK